MEINKRLQRVWALMNDAQRDHFKKVFNVTSWKDQHFDDMLSIEKGEKLRHETAKYFYEGITDFITTNKGIELSDKATGEKEYLKNVNQYLQLCMLYGDPDLRDHNFREFVKEANRIESFDLLAKVLTWKQNYECLALSKPENLTPIGEQIKDIEAKRDLVNLERDTENRALSLYTSYFVLIDHKGNGVVDEKRLEEIINELMALCSRCKTGRSQYLHGLVMMDRYTRRGDMDIVKEIFLDTVKVLDKYPKMRGYACASSVYSDFMDSVLQIGTLEDVEGIANCPYRPVQHYNHLLFSLTRVIALVHLKQADKALEILDTIDPEKYKKQPFELKRLAYYRATCYYIQGKYGLCTSTLLEATLKNFDHNGYNLGVRYLEMLCYIKKGDWDALESRLNSYRSHINTTKSKYEYLQSDKDLYLIIRHFCNKNGSEVLKTPVDYRIGGHVSVNVVDELQKHIDESAGVKKQQVK